MTWIRAIWAFSRRLRFDPGHGLRPRSGAAALWVFLFLVALPVGLLLLLLGFDLDEVDRWLARNAGWFDLVGAIAFKGAMAVVLLFCLLLGGVALHARIRAMIHRVAGSRPAPAPDDAPGWGSLLVSVVIGYFAAVALLT